MSDLLRWPSQEPRASIVGRLEVDTKRFDMAFVRLPSGHVMAANQAGEDLRAGEDVILIGPLWWKARS